MWRNPPLAAMSVISRPPVKNILFWGLYLLWAGVVHGQDFTGERLWTSKDGKTFRGIFHRVLLPGDKAEIADTQGKIYQIPLSALSDADRALILESPVPAARVYKELPALDRSRIPVINQGDFGQKSSDCVPSSLCNFLLWWDQEKVLEIPKRGDFQKKAEWIHTLMARLCVTRNNSGTSLSAVKEAFAKYFKTELADVATCEYEEDYDLGPENMARHTVGANATMLGMTILDSRDKESGHWVALISVDPSGKLVFQTWGARFEGELKVLEEKLGEFYQIDGKKVPATKYEIRILNPLSLPEWVREDGIRFILDPGKRNGVFTIRPLVFQK